MLNCAQLYRHWGVYYYNKRNTLNTFNRDKKLTSDISLLDSSRVFEWKDKEAFYWLEKCALLQNKAKSCGLYGFAVLHSILVTECQEGSTIRSHFFTRCAPTYYGMMCAYFEKLSPNT